MTISELVGLEVRDLQFEGDGSATVYVRHSKFDQVAEGVTFYVDESISVIAISLILKQAVDEARLLARFGTH